ncbi:MAG: hypothetical protein KJN67_03040 [Pontiella sp.]|nr:hypothetical protein [Pontiella sp.]MBT8046121.1 hypothetical protein [Pontiella sp.]
MNRMLLFSILLFAAGFALGSEPASTAGADGDAGLSESRLNAAEQRLATITDPAARLYFTAGTEWAKGEPEKALQTLSESIVHHAYDEKWIAKSELLSARLYVELGMLDAADVTARQVQALYEGSEVAEKATALRIEVEQLKKETEAKRSTK